MTHVPPDCCYIFYHGSSLTFTPKDCARRGGMLSAPSLSIMSSFIFTRALHPWVSHETAQDILIYTHYSSPVILVTFFLVAFTAHSIATASVDTIVRPSTEQTGPGGKPLPQKVKPSAKERQQKNALDFSRGKKLLFEWLSVGTSLTFIGNAVVVILHTLFNRKDNWWCGESVAVCLYLETITEQTALT